MGWKIGRKHAKYLINPKREGGTVHTFRKALSEHESCDLDFAQMRQMQETYVGRWVDVVRAWLRFSAAVSLSNSSSDGQKESHLFGEHYATIKLLKDVLSHFVYSSPDNAKLNARAETVLRGLLDKFIPAAEECIQMGDRKRSPISPDGLPETTKALIALIPMRYRLDYEAAYSNSNPTWDEAKQKYELDMMVLDFISSLPDDYAIQLYNELYRA